MKKFLLSLSLMTGLLAAQAQTPSTSGPGSNCNVFRNFNQFDEDFTTPSIYSDDDDVSLFYNTTRGALVENSGLTGARRGSVISPAYLNSLDNEVTVGFAYEAPAGTEYRIRVVSALSNPPERILATTANGSVYTPLPSTSGTICVRIQDLDLNANEAYRFEVTYRYSGPTGSGATPFLFDDIALTVVGGPLPVTFEGFLARPNADGTTKLLWDVAREINVSRYDVETSTDGRNFSTVAQVNASGKSVYAHNYTALIKGTMFFRIKSVDADGSAKYSGIIRVKGDNQATTINVYPIPATDKVYVEHNKVGNNAMITVLSPDGKVIKQQRPVANSYQTQVNVNELKPGVYFVRYDNGEGKVETVKLVKQ
jgi:hypothetical protein